jgi:CRISPR/Cas system-associated exonuclease Cas4 (RecB family)
MPRKRNKYEPKSDKKFRLSRSKVDLFLQCPRCFYLDRRLGVSRPAGFPFNLNSAVDQLLKSEFDQYREEQRPHPYMVQANVDAIPYQHPDLETWRANFKGVSHFDRATNLELFGAVDDVWEESGTGRLIVVDYKATSKSGEVTIDAPWQISYKRQMEFYQWLMRKNGFDVSPTGYFLYCNGDRSRDRFDEQLEFSVKLLPYDGNDAWIERTIEEIHLTLEGDTIPDGSPDCEYCKYVLDAQAVST